MHYSNSNAGYSWYRTRTVTVKLNTGETMTGSPVELAGDDGRGGVKGFTMYECMGCSLAAVARQGKIVEVEYDGIRYRVLSQCCSSERTQLNCEPIGSVPVAANKPSVQDQVLGALRTTPDGMTARQISEALDCTRQWVFSALAGLMKSKQVKKDGFLYQISEG